MADPTEAGATGRKPRGGDAPQGGSALAPVPEPEPSTTIAAPGTAALVVDPAIKPVVIGAAAVPVAAGGPGAGALRTASETEAFEARSLERLDDAPLGASERAELDMLRRSAGIGRGLTVDAAAVTGKRWARTATTVKRDGRTYPPGEPVLLDYAGYVELVAIAAITDVPWRELEPVDGD